MTRQVPNLGPDLAALDDLATVRDWLRYAVTRFSGARLSFGHGTTRALDEAAFLILHTLTLPVDELDPWLDASLTRAERSRVLEVIEKRIATRKPAPYLTHEAWIKGHSFYVDERVIVPRSYIGELLADGIASVVAEPERITRVLDLCTGSGCLAIMAALAFPRAVVDAVDLSSDALDVARINLRDYGLGERVRLFEGDLFEPLAGQTFDLVITNPPYVSEAAVAAFPPEFRAEPLMAHAGGRDGLDIVRRILAAVPEHLTPRGALVMEIGTGRAIIEAEFPHLPFLWLDSVESEGEVLAIHADDLSVNSAARKAKVTRKVKGKP